MDTRETEHADGDEAAGTETHESGPESERASVFEELLGSRGRVKMLEAFLNQAGTTVTAGEIAEFAGFSQSTFSRYIDLFEELEIVEVADQVGNTTLYRLNEDSELAGALAQVQYHLRKQVGEIPTEEWSTADREPMADQKPDGLEREVARLVPQLFVAEEESKRVEYADRLQEIAQSDPSAAVDVVPALVELADDDNPEVSQRIVTALSHVVAHKPESVGREEVTRLLQVVPAALKTAQEIELDLDTDEDEPSNRQPVATAESAAARGHCDQEDADTENEHATKN